MAGIAHHHSEIALLVSLAADGEMAPRTQGEALVVIDAIDGKIGLMLRPFPVILIAAEGGDAHGRSGHQAHVRVFGVQANIVGGASPHTLQTGLQAIFVAIFLLQDGR